MIILRGLGRPSSSSRRLMTRTLLSRQVRSRRHESSRCYSSEQKPWSTPLAKTIGDAIKTTGPISIAAYMRQCLTSPVGGYYTSETRNRDQIGQKGDFITSPEISQIFGELVAIWFVSQWIAQGRPDSGVELIELGPGKGTLMDDVLRTIRNFQPMASSIEKVFLVEASSTLRAQQHQLLCGPETKLEKIDIGWQSRSKHTNTRMIWCEDLKSVPTNRSGEDSGATSNDLSIRTTPFIVAHEFFDALPIQAFQSVAPSPEASQTLQGLNGPIRLNKAAAVARTPQWRELLVTSRGATSGIITSSRPKLAKARSEADEFQLTLAKALNPASMLLPEISERYRALKDKPDSVIEISPESHAVVADIARRIGGKPSKGTKGVLNAKSSGAALIIDYGTTNTIPTNTLRGIRSHQPTSPFSSPGEVDLSADVDFTALAEVAIDASEGVEVHGPMEQGEWLQRMGIHERAQALLDTTATSEDAKVMAQKVQDSVKRLVERGGGAMGKVYKAMAIVPESGGQRPVGFGGGVDI